MLLILVGESGAGKDYICNYIKNNYQFKEIITYTTRSPRPGEIDGINYHFISPEKFKQYESKGFFLETDEYSNNRFYGTSYTSIEEAIHSNKNYIIVVNPIGLRAIKNTFYSNNYHLIHSIYITAPLGTRVKRYIDRLNEKDFNFTDMNEINARVNRDFGMFKGIDKEVNFVYENNKPFLHEIDKFVNDLSLDNSYCK